MHRILMTRIFEDYPPLAGGARSPVRHCAGLLITVEAQGLIVNIVTTDIDVEDLKLRNKWYLQGIRVGTYTVDF